MQPVGSTRYAGSNQDEKPTAIRNIRPALRGTVVLLSALWLAAEPSVFQSASFSALRAAMVQYSVFGDPQAVFSQDGLLDELKKALAERMLNAEMDEHLAREKAGAEGPAKNHRNGYGRKRVLTDSGGLELSIPRDRESRSSLS